MAAKTKYDRFVALALKLGADEAKIISAGSIVTAPWVRLKCQFGCSGYNATYCCPPHTPTPEQTRSVIDSYRKAILLHNNGRGRMTKTIVQLEREIFLAGYYKAFGFGSGPCSLCRACPEEGCTHPEKARPSMESCGIDVYATARGNRYPIKVVKDESCDQNYYGVVLIE
jgi:predicted metal-binding protein